MQQTSPGFLSLRPATAMPDHPEPRDRATPLAAVWAFAYGLLAVMWTFGVTGFPFGRGYDPDPEYSNLAALASETGAPVIAAWAFVAAGAATILRWNGAPPIVPASVIAILIIETGIMYNRMALTGTWEEEFRTGNWATVVPEMTWPLWGLALGAAAVAYHYRRRGRCEACGRV